MESGDPAAAETAAGDIRKSLDLLRNEFIQLTTQLCEGEDDRAEVDIAEILRDLAILYEDRFREAKARIESPDSSLSLKCTTFASDLKIALHEVIVNAAEALEHLHVQAKDRVCRMTAEATQGGVRIEVVDNGPGFSDTAMQRMFQLPERTGSLRSGRGKGLYVAQRMMRSIGGGIQTENVLSDGGANRAHREESARSSAAHSSGGDSV